MPDASEDKKSPSPAQRAWLRRGLSEPGGKLPLFDEDGQQVDPRTIRACIEQGWAEPWFANPIKPDWLICKLTEAGRNVVSRSAQKLRLALSDVPKPPDNVYKIGPIKN